MVEYEVKEGTTATVYGDIHGQLYDFLYALEQSGRPSEKNMLLFNGVCIRYPSLMARHTRLTALLSIHRTLSTEATGVLSAFSSFSHTNGFDRTTHS